MELNEVVDSWTASLGSGSLCLGGKPSEVWRTQLHRCVQLHGDTSRSLHEILGTFQLSWNLPAKKTLCQRLYLIYIFKICKSLFSVLPCARNKVCPSGEGVHISYTHRLLNLSFLVLLYIGALNIYFKNTFPDSYKEEIKVKVFI